MKKLIRLTSVLAILLATAVSFGQSNDPKYGLSASEITLSDVQKVKKNTGVVRVSFSTNCHDSEEEALSAVQAAQSLVLSQFEKEAASYVSQNLLVEANVVIEGRDNELKPLGTDKYTLLYPRDNELVKSRYEYCYQKTALQNDWSLNAIAEVRNAKTYELYSSVSITINSESTNELALLSAIKQNVFDYFSEYESDFKAVKINVQNPRFDLDEESKKSISKSVINDLDINSQANKYTVERDFISKYGNVSPDLAFAVDIVEPSTGVNNNTYLEYQDVYPQLQENGEVKLQTNSVFNVSYVSTNNGTDKSADIPIRSRNFNFESSVTLPEADVESYQASVGVGVECYESSEEANFAFKQALNKATAEIRNILESNIGDNRLEIETSNSPSQYNSFYEDINKRIVQRTTNGNQNNYTTPSTWWSSCSGEKFSDTTKDNLPKLYKVSQTFQVYTNKFETFQKVKDYLEANKKVIEAVTLESNKLASVVSGGNSVSLKEESWRNAVNASLYEDALYQLTEPDGDVAKYLTDVKAFSAYYELSTGQQISPLESMSFVAAPQSASCDDCDQDRSYDGNRVNISGDDLALAELVTQKGYTVISRPAVDLLTLIEGRKAALSNTQD